VGVGGTGTGHSARIASRSCQIITRQVYPGGEPDVTRGRFEPGLRSSGGSSVELSVGGSS
jgi:hypothetical protein